MSEHAHRFQLGTPNGPTSVGVCACGETRTYTNGQDIGNGKQAHHKIIARKHLVDAESGFQVFPTRLVQQGRTK